MTTDLDFAEFRDLMIEDLRARQRERTAGHTLARIHDDVRGLGIRLAKLESRTDSLEAKCKSDPPPGKPRHTLVSLAEISDDEPTAVRNFKREELASAVANNRFMMTLWKVATALAITVAAIVTIYGQLRNGK